MKTAIDNLRHEDGGDTFMFEIIKKMEKLDRREVTPHSGFGIPEDQHEVIKYLLQKVTAKK